MERNLPKVSCGQARLAEGRNPGGLLLTSIQVSEVRCIQGHSSKKVSRAFVTRTKLAKFLGLSEQSVQASGQLIRGTVSRACERGGQQVSEKGKDKKKKRKKETEEGDGTKMCPNQTRSCSTVLGKDTSGNLRAP